MGVAAAEVLASGGARRGSAWRAWWIELAAAFAVWARVGEDGTDPTADDRLAAATVPGECRIHRDTSLPPATPDFDAFFTRHERPLYTYLRRLLPTDEAARDIAQETFLRAWSHFERIAAYNRPEAWLYRVATNLAISALRRHQPLSFSRLFRRGDHLEHDDAPGGGEMWLPDATDLEGQTADRDLIVRVLLRLPERQRAALLLRAGHGFSVEEVATMLGITIPNAYQLLSRGAKRFRELYEAARHDAEANS